MRTVASKPFLVLFLLFFSSFAGAQTPIATITLGPEQIGVVKAAQGITTRITFPDPVSEIICGDLYDPNGSRGTFVIQRSGTDQHPGTDIFLKPVTSKGMSNMFVKTGDGKRTYAFDLKVVPIEQAHRVVNVLDAAGAAASQTVAQANAANNSGTHTGAPDSQPPAPDFERMKAEVLQDAREQAAEILRNARQQADRINAEAEAKVADADHQAAARGEQETQRRFVQALMLGLREVKVNNSKVAIKKVVVNLDSRVLVFGERAYLRYTIQNAGSEPFIYSAISLESGQGKDAHAITVEVAQTKTENKLEPGEVLTGIIIFDPKQVAPKEKITLFLRGEENAEIAHVTLQ